MEEFMYLGLRMIDGISRDDFFQSLWYADRGGLSGGIKSSAGGVNFRATVQEGYN